MAIKVYFNNQIHRLTKLPDNLQDLLAQITSLFKNELPSSWKLQYLDSEGDQIIVSHEHDFKELKEIESSTSNFTLKLYILPNEGLAQPNVNNSHYQPAKYPSFEEYEVIQDSPKDQQGLLSQYQGEKTVNTDYQVINDLQNNIEVEPRVSPQPKNEGFIPTNFIQFHKAKHLVKMMVRGKYPETMKDQMLNELNAIKETLTEDEKKALEQKQTMFEERRNKHGHWKGHHEHHHGHHGHHFKPHHHHAPHFGPQGHLGNHRPHFGPLGHFGHHAPHFGHQGIHGFHGHQGHNAHPFGHQGMPGIHGHHGHHAHRDLAKGFGWRKFGRFDSSSDEEKGNSKSFFRLFKFMKVLRKLMKAQRKGKTEKAAQRKEKLLGMVPEDGRPILEAVLASLPKDLDKETMKGRLMSGIKKFIEECFPEGKDKILEELEKAKERRKHMKGHHFKGHHYRHHKGHFSRMMQEEEKEHSLEKTEKKVKGEGKVGKCERKRMFGFGCDKEKSELLEKYSKGVFKKAATLKMIFSQQEMGKLCEYVSQKPEESSIEELVMGFHKLSV